MASNTRAAGPTEPVQYYLAVAGLPGADLALLAARGAILAHRRFRGHPGYARWHSRSMAKVVLRAEAGEIASLARAYDGLTIPEAPDVPQLAVFRPRPKSQAAFLGQLKLYSGRIGPSVRAEWPQGDLYVPVFLNADLDLSAGKTAAQVAHAMLLVQEVCGALGVWRDWLVAGMPTALARAPEPWLRRLIKDARAWGVEDEGRTETPTGSLTVAASAPGTLGTVRGDPDVAMLAHGFGRPVTER
jgi:peptidyl-tRNA hydrolase, PTH2 family